MLLLYSKIYPIHYYFYYYYSRQTIHPNPNPILRVNPYGSILLRDLNIYIYIHVCNRYTWGIIYCKVGRYTYTAVGEAGDGC